MKILDCLKIIEKAYIEDLDNGLKVIIVPKKESTKKFVIWGTRFGSIDNKFILPETGEEVTVPDGVAHFLEHKMFEQPDGTNSLDTMMALGLDANAYTTNDHTAYLFECSEGDHVHCFVSAPPKLSITAIIKYLKGITGRKLFERFPEIRNQLWKGELWNHSYYVETIGSVSEENIRRYIEHQSKSY